MVAKRRIIIRGYKYGKSYKFAFEEFVKKYMEEYINERKKNNN